MTTSNKPMREAHTSKALDQPAKMTEAERKERLKAAIRTHALNERKKKGKTGRGPA